MKKGNFSLKVVGFWLVMILITAIFAVVFINKITKVTTFDSMDDVKKAGLMLNNDLTSQSETTYYVYLFSSEDKDNVIKKQNLEPAIYSYFTYVAKNNQKESIVKIYAYDLDNYKSLPGYTSVYEYLTELNSNLVGSNMPMLIKVSSGSINTYTTESNIESELQTARLS